MIRRATMPLCLMACQMLFAGAERRFEKIALIDNMDFAGICDIETEKGTRQMLDHICLSHPTAFALRDKSGGLPRFASVEEVGIPCEEPMDKRRICREDIYGWLRLGRRRFDDFDVVFSYCERKDLKKFVHATFEEAHWCIELISPWNFEHPQYWCRARGCAPWAGHVSLAFPAVREHKLRYLDELLARRPDAVFLDLSRNGGWSAEVEFVPPVLERWKRLYGSMPPPRNATDPRWLKLVEEDIMGYLREYGRKCHAAGARFLIGFHHLDPANDTVYRTMAIDWRALAQDGTIDGLVAMSTVYGPKDPYGVTRRALEGLKKALGKADLYSHVSMYNYSRAGVPQFAKDANEPVGTVAARLLGIAKEAGCAGVVMECVDYKNYPDEVNDALK